MTYGAILCSRNGWKVVLELAYADYVVVAGVASTHNPSVIISTRFKGTGSMAVATILITSSTG